jgi:autotransporter-associated beta strand protein
MKLSAEIFARICAFLLCLPTVVQAAESSGLILNVPDWNQPGEYNGAGGGQINGYTDWCAPTAGANIMGYWEDIRGKVGLADRQVYPNSPNYPGTVGTYEKGLWHDGTIEMGWYMDTNLWRTNAGPFPPGGGGLGTAEGSIGPGLLNYAKGSWTDNDYPLGNPQPGTGIVKTAFQDALVDTTKLAGNPQNYNWGRMWYDYVSEINSHVPVEISFGAWVDLGIGPSDTKTINGQEVKVYDNWKIAESAGHAVVGVGYIDPDPTNFNFDEYFICQDNWPDTFRDGSTGTGRYVAVPVGPTAAASEWHQNVYLWAAPIGYLWTGADETNISAWAADNWVNLAWTGPGHPIPDGYGATITFGNQPSGHNVVDLDTADRTVSNITFNSITSTTILSTGSRTLKLDNGPNPSIVTVAGTHAINANIALNSNANITVTSGGDQLSIGGAIRDGIYGPKGIIKDGSGLLVLSGLNIFNGPVIVAAGTLKVGNAAALGSPVAGTMVGNGATLDMNGYDLGTEQVTIQGTGVSGNGAITSTNVPAYPYSILHKLTLNGNATIGNVPGWRWDMENPVPGNPTTGYLQGNGYTLTKVGGGDIWLKQLGDTGLGDIFINGGRLGFQQIIGAGNQSKTITVATDASLGVWDTGQYQVLNKKLVFQNGSSFYSGGGTGNFWTGDTTLNGTMTFLTDVNLTLNGNITGTGGITKNGPGTVFITGTPSYNGQTIIDAGTLQVNTGSAISLHAVSGAGALGVDNSTSLTADSINLGTLTIGAGSTVIIAPIPGRPLAEPGSQSPVPEPSTWAMFVLAAMGLGIYRCRCHCCIKSSLF